MSIKQKINKTFYKEIKLFTIFFIIFNLISLLFIIKILPRNAIVSFLWKSQKKLTKDTIDSERDNLFRKNDIKSLITIKNNESVFLKRIQLSKYIYGESQIDKYDSLIIKRDINDDKFENLFNLKQIDEIEIPMEFGIKSYAYRFLPIKANNKLIIYHQGHSGDFFYGKDSISYFLSKGYEVIAFSMPLIGTKNSRPTIYIKNIGFLEIDNHDKLEFLPNNDKSSSLKYFTYPISKVLDHILKENSYKSVSMIGISGGGWTTTLLAALDKRINYSFPVAGTLPLFLRTYDFKDSENWTYDLYKRINYLDLYILASVGYKNRAHLQILNKFDPCCYAGERYKYYGKKLSSIVDNLKNGEFDIFVDDSHKSHIISKETLEKVHKFIIKKENNLLVNKIE